MTDLVLSLFPGIGLLDMAFERAGFCVVRGPDLLWGGDVRNFHVPPGKFNGLIGGPPCQIHSSASEIRGTEAQDLIPEFIRCWREGDFDFSVMENVMGAKDHPDIPKEWHRCVLRDFDCGGLTARERCFWTWPMQGTFALRADGRPQKSVMASTWKRGKSESQYVTDRGFLPGDLPIERYGELQGCPDLASHLKNHPSKPSRSWIVHVLGNGVPLPMGSAIANAVKEHREPQWCVK